MWPKCGNGAECEPISGYSAGRAVAHPAHCMDTLMAVTEVDVERRFRRTIRCASLVDVRPTASQRSRARIGLVDDGVFPYWLHVWPLCVHLRVGCPRTAPSGILSRASRIIVVRCLCHRACRRTRSMSGHPAACQAPWAALVVDDDAGVRQ